MSRVLTHVSLIGFATALSARAVDPIIPQIAADLAVEPEKVALLSSAFALPFAIVQPILGPMADMFGKIRLMFACLLVLIAASIACVVASGFPTLMAARIVAGIATGGIFPVGLAIAGDLVPVDKRQVAIGRLLAVVITGNLLGASLSGAVGDLFGWRAVFLAVTAGGLFALISATIGLRGVVVGQTLGFDLRTILGGYLGIFANPRAKACYGAVFVDGIAVFGAFPFVALLLAASGETRAAIAGLVLAGFSIGGLVYSLGVPIMLGRWRPEHLMVGGGVLAALALTFASLGPAWPLQFLAFTLLGIGFYTFHASIQVEATELSATARGAATSLHSLFFFLGQAAGPALYGLGFASVGSGPSLIAGALVMLVAGFVCARLLARPDEV
ncbi:MAG TPA: MFS transporter [Xanthobacteraceae bacterium]|nr:MFS transporter [Xanthobacteraceae bacterium]